VLFFVIAKTAPKMITSAPGSDGDGSTVQVTTIIFKREPASAKF
jgi:hypothetical protein